MLTGIGTVLADDPLLTSRRIGQQRQPLRVVLDSKLRLPLTAKLLQAPGVCLMHAQTDPAKQSALQARGVESIQVVGVGPAGAAARCDLQAVLQALAARGMNEIWVEAGATLAGAFVTANLFDELIIYLAPTLLGNGGSPLLVLPGLQRLQDRPDLKFQDIQSVGADVRLTVVRAS